MTVTVFVMRCYRRERKSKRRFCVCCKRFVITFERVEGKSKGRFCICCETLQKVCNCVWNVNLCEISVMCCETLQKVCNYVWNVNLCEGSVRRYRRFIIMFGT